MLDDERSNALQVRTNIFRCDPKRLYATALRPLVAPLVTCGIVAEIVRKPIDLNRHTSGLAEEIEHERAERMLPAEL